jgi:hypothetical protein
MPRYIYSGYIYIWPEDYVGIDMYVYFNVVICN